MTIENVRKNINDKHLLREIFGKGVDGNNSNCYRKIIPALEYSVNAGWETINTKQLLMVLKNLSVKWEKEIDEVVG